MFLLPIDGKKIQQSAGKLYFLTAVTLNMTCNGSVPPASSIFYSQFFHPAPQGAQIDPKQLGGSLGTVYPAIGEFQRTMDMVRHYFVQLGEILPLNGRFRQVAVMLFHEHTFKIQRAFSSQHKLSLDHVFELPHIIKLAQRYQGLFSEIISIDQQSIGY